ncbi:hypothetical protein [Azospirillum cavernae]|uniref:hypothetical protein n=1 Tax=Azospirillum cavernae TaxID=2320860 RepID=UPI0011C384D9|nr:hypothetical protein [Azospirillum cavernae]
MDLTIRRFSLRPGPVGSGEKINGWKACRNSGSVHFVRGADDFPLTETVPLCGLFDIKIDIEKSNIRI